MVEKGTSVGLEELSKEKEEMVSGGRKRLKNMG